jgi:hypothetical protein
MFKLMDQPVIGTEQEIPAWKIKRTENLAKARAKADELRKEIRDASVEKPKGKQRLKSKLALLKNEAVNASTAQVVVKSDKEPVDVDKPEPEPEPESEPEPEQEPEVDLKKSIRPKAKKQPKIVVPQEESEEESEEEEEPPKKTLKRVASVKFIEDKPKITQGRDGLWYF